jgi:hypothetical protein
MPPRNAILHFPDFDYLGSSESFAAFIKKTTFSGMDFV